MMPRFFRRAAVSVLCAASFVLATPVWAEDPPDVQVKNVSAEVLAIVREDKGIAAGDMRHAVELIDAKVSPHFNFTRMAALAVGRDWRAATPEQKTALTAEFRALLVRSYSNALNRFKELQIVVKPLRMEANADEVIVRTEVRQPGKAADTVDYSLEKKDGQWKVYDVSVAGVSLISSYRDSFGQEIKASGIDGLIKSLKAKNSKNSESDAASGNSAKK